MNETLGWGGNGTALATLGWLSTPATETPEEQTFSGRQNRFTTQIETDLIMISAIIAGIVK